MKKGLVSVVLMGMTISLIVACGSARKAKRGCPSSSSSMGAERVLAGEKAEKPSKFKIKGMN